MKNLKKSTLIIAFVVVLISISLTGCDSNSSQSTSSPTTQPSVDSSGQQSNNPSMQQQQPGHSGQSQSPNAPDMTAVLNRAAEILGISSDKFTTAFQNAMPKPSTDQQEQPPAPPTGTPPTGTHPSDQQGQPPEPPTGAPQSGQPKSQSENPQFMTDVYAKMAEELNISVDDISKAMTQAEEELKK